MGSYDHRDFLREHFGSDAFLPQQTLSMSVSEASSSLSISLPASMSYQLGSPTYNNTCCTPRTIAPHPSYMLSLPTHGYHPEEAYAITGHSASARGRSCSGASTVSAEYSVASQEATPRSAYSFVEASTQYRAPYDDQVTHTGAPVLNSQEELSTPQNNQGHFLKQEGDEPNPSNSKSVADRQTFCPHRDCLDEEGRPRRFFSRKADVTRHYKSRHDIKYIDCPKRNCERKGSQGFTRRDHLTEHLRGFHMEKIAKRQISNSKAKRGEKPASEDSNGSNSSSEGLTPPEHADEISYVPCGQPSFAELIAQDIKQETPPSSDDEAEDIFPICEVYLPKRTRRFKSLAQRRKIKARALQNHAIPMARSNVRPHHSPTSATARGPLQGLAFQADFATPRMMPDSPAYATHHQDQQHQHQVFTTSNMVAPLYTTNSSMDSFYGPSSMAQVYDNLPAQVMAPYRVEALDRSHFQPMQE
ncbi:uncharacterized protein Z519_11946 [Cladophialophora bantiana CBS 173.52]|uniref:C2H2-type domain-containing protein n=1 Tax=Cladophialophora bantiana (strain ATCC 10958 / CBS 173.52 / CDC B-1940 / NIH 8579) TaxID=1442370 RepID=A0A0D2H8V0_CLAB1|nr:uncharacterized protein Z519_11946 [Cladophialophora bantiana CBS 173.52]KIW87310.1 hypothetical protein Z519_11946 [Cladophialophora bantiana CBS 173.52]